ncbi:MAG: DUF1294 domain-containing protein [Clostridia bacterium]|nr:DUF1294 domain-containing protein [Clostridia bacterium]
MFLIYYTAISIVAVFSTIIDKNHAKRKLHRFPEKTLVNIALLGGALPMYITMKIIRYKTLHKKFMIGLPVIILFQIAISILIVINFYNIVL